MAWKNPILTGGLLVVLNIATIVFNKMGMSIIGFAVWKIMIYSVVSGLKSKFTPAEKEYFY
jgi:hypothetical protein